MEIREVNHLGEILYCVMNGDCTDRELHEYIDKHFCGTLRGGESLIAVFTDHADAKIFIEENQNGHYEC